MPSISVTYSNPFSISCVASYIILVLLLMIWLMVMARLIGVKRIDVAMSIDFLL